MSLKGSVWAPMGPSPIAENALRANGLVSAIAINPNNPSLIYIGTAGGGVWRSPDGGATWTPIFDRQLSLAVGEPGGLAIDPNNTDTLYVGTSARISGQPQAGLFKSTDRGASWIRVGSGFPAGNTGNASQFVNQWINVIIVDPANSNIVYLGSTSGVFRSVDGGQNWTFGSNAGGDARSLVLDPSSPAGARILYAGLSGRGAFQSTDGGQSWTQILSATTPAVAAAVGPSPAGFGKVIVDIPPPTSPANPAGVQVIYVALQGTGGAPDPVGVFQSTNQGGTWTQRAAAGMPTNTQGGYSFHMALDPDSPGDGLNDIIYFGAVRQARSTDAGASFTGLTGLHADTHSWAFIRQASPTPSIIFSGNDGGIYTSKDGGATWTSLNAGGLQTSLFYNIDVRPDATASVTVGALQDNEVETTKGGTGLGWVATSGGDGWDVAYDGVTAGRVYSTSGFYSPNPCTRVFRSNDDGATFPTEITPWGTTSDAGCYLAPITTDPSAAGVVYVSGSQNLWQSRDGGTTWRILSPFPSTGNIDVAKVNGNNVVIAVGRRVFVSTNALAATVGPPSGVVFTEITRNLPSRNVARALFDPVDPTVVFAVLGGFNGGAGQNGHVFRTTIGAAAWTDISPSLNIPFNAIALDGSDTPTTLYVGTDFGVLRSVDTGKSWSVLDDIHFPRAPVLDLILSDQARILRAATYGRGVFQFVPATGPVISVDLQQNLTFLNVCTGPAFLTLQILNVGVSNLVIDSVQRLMGSTGFSVLPTPATPVVIRPGEELDFTVVFIPTTPGIAELAIIRITSNDPNAPVLDVQAIGIGGLPKLETAIADNGNFGDACLGSFADEPLVIDNAGVCPLVISGISSSSPEFAPPNVIAYPLVVAAGGTIEIPLRFAPAGFGLKSATVTVTSNGGVRTVAVSGDCPPPRLALSVADAGSFGKVCVGSFVDRPLTLNNAGRCTLSVTNIASSTAEFVVPEVISYPLAVGAGDSMQLPIRFQPTSLGAKSATLTISSNDPAGARTIGISGEAPPGKLAVTGSTEFGCVECGQQAEQIISICNVGECDLHVTEVAFRYKERLRQKCRRFKLIHNPFPATVRAGSCLNVVIRYKAACEPPKCCHLVIVSDDPETPIRTLDVSARTCCCTCECGDPRCCGCCGRVRRDEGREAHCCGCCNCRRGEYSRKRPEEPTVPG